MFFIRKRPIAEHHIELFAQQYIDWAIHDEDALIINDFPFKVLGMYPSHFQHFIKEYPVLTKAHEVAKAAIASRRERGAIKREMDGAMIRPSMPMYSKDWKNLAEWNAKLKQKEDENKSQNITVVFDKSPSTDIVPERKE